MTLIGRLTETLGRAEAFRETLDVLDSGRDMTLATPGIIRPLLVASVFWRDPRPTFVVVAGEESARRFARQLAAYMPHEQVLHYEDREDLPWAAAPADPRVVARRTRALHALSSGRPVVVVASARALLRVIPPQGSHVFEPLALERGAQLDLTEVGERLARMGYERLPAAEEPGQFAVRGGVLDVFAGDSVYPVRAEFFGDEVESLRRFVPSTGQSIGDASETEIYPIVELALGSRAAAAAERELREKALDDPFVAHHLDMIKSGTYFSGIEMYLPVLYRSQGLPSDYVGSGTLVVVAEPRSLFNDAARRHEELVAAANRVNRDIDGLFASAAELDLGGRQTLTLLSLLSAGGAVDAELVVRRPEVSGGEDAFISGIRTMLKAGSSVLLAVPERRTRQRITDTCVQVGLQVSETIRSAESVAASAQDGEDVSLLTEAITPADIDIPSGFVIDSAKLAVVSIDDVYPRSAVARQRAREVDPTRVTFSFAPGDYVVHASHGVAMFTEFVRKEILGSERDYLVLTYAKGDKLYVPVEQIDRITRYVGPEGASPRVTRLNTADWSRATGRARAAARKLAFDLVDLYARRSAVEGHAFVADTVEQMEMEAAFPFIETPDQLAAIADVKVDMQSPSPMDRLICGDVGYGKTEVAIRAAFKAVSDSKQVMILCPTTILAQQHYTTFSERFAPFEVSVEVLSRFRTPAQQRTSIEQFAEGEVDVLIGTHRLLSADVSPKDLGLVIIDEEQRFGVGHKEHLKNLREQVDVLTLTATPIPRTLQMSLSGVRDMSVIDTPPPNRFPVKIHVGEYDADVVSGAIRREMERGGQVYFVSNRVMTIDDAVQRVRDAAPEVRIGVAHGQMSERQLERIMESFSAGEYDVLVSTTIVESGIDNPHTNTLIIEDSQRLGLAQLYQLKGRVGRSHVRAFAYFFFPRGTSLTEQATERLTAIGESIELGSGIKVAMRDLEIRGAGTLLGAEQHGTMSAVGFDLYAEMLREAVAEARGEPEVAYPQIRVEMPVAAYLPEEYVPAVDERVRIYRRLAGAPATQTVGRIAEQLAEEYGIPPQPAANLLAGASIRALAADLGVEHVKVAKGRLTLSPIDMTSELQGRLAKSGSTYRERNRTLVVPLAYGGSVTDGVLGILGAILTGAETAIPDSQEDR